MICDGCEKEVFRARFDAGATGKWLCKDCDPGPRPDKPVFGVNFPYVTQNLGDSPHPIKVESLRHLRKLEAKYGVENVAYNWDSQNWNDPPRNNVK